MKGTQHALHHFSVFSPECTADSYPQTHCLSIILVMIYKTQQTHFKPHVNCDSDPPEITVGEKRQAASDEAMPLESVAYSSTSEKTFSKEPVV